MASDTPDSEAVDGAPVSCVRFVVRPQSGRFRVIDIWTGETAIIAMTPQDDLSQLDAVHTAQLLNRRVARGDRSILQ